MRSRYRTLACAALALGAVLASPSADARGGVGFGIGLGFPIFAPPPIAYYAPPPAYYYPPPPIAYAPPPSYAAPPAYAAPTAAGQQCREYQSTAMINGQPQQTVGTACLQPDGTWRIVR